MGDLAECHIADIQGVFSSRCGICVAVETKTEMYASWQSRQETPGTTRSSPTAYMVPRNSAAGMAQKR